LAGSVHGVETEKWCGRKEIPYGPRGFINWRSFAFGILFCLACQSKARGEEASPHAVRYEIMKQDSALKLSDQGIGITAVEGAKPLFGPNRRAEVLRKASAQFAITGLHGTTTLALAQAAGVSQAVLVVHFGDKTQLFKEAVEMNIEARLRLLDGHLSAIAVENRIDWIESMAEATLMACLADAANAMLLSWALLEAPEFATDLYRYEIGSVRILWEREIARRFPSSRTREIVSLHIVPYAVNTCLAHGLWFATLRHTPESAEPLARQFAISIAQSASTILGPS
jgi:AcrR family transcriptional regulator